MKIEREVRPGIYSAHKLPAVDPNVLDLIAAAESKDLVARCGLGCLGKKTNQPFRVVDLDGPLFEERVSEFTIDRNSFEHRLLLVGHKCLDVSCLQRSDLNRRQC